MTTATEKTSPNTWQQWGLGLLHGPSQIYFQKNVITGVLIFAAFFAADWRMGVLTFIGAVGGILGGRQFGFTLSSIGSGMQSFNGTLVGAAVFAALGGGTWWSYALALLGGITTGPVTWFVNWLFTKTTLAKFTLPYTTAPFVIVASVIAYSTLHWSVASPPSSRSTEPVIAFLTSLLTNVSQVVLVNNVWSGALILIGLFVANWKVGLTALLGSAVGSVAGVMLGESWGEIANGLAGYSGVLTAIAIAVTYLKSSVVSWIYALPWIVITAAVTLLMHRLGVETYTWPYILTTWVALVAVFYSPRLKRS